MSLCFDKRDGVLAPKRVMFKFVALGFISGCGDMQVSRQKVIVEVMHTRVMKLILLSRNQSTDEGRGKGGLV